MTKTLTLLAVGVVIAAGAGGIAWKASGSSGPRAVVVEARDALTALDFARLQRLMGKVAQHRFESSMFNETNDLRSKDGLAKLLGVPAEQARAWGAWEYLGAVAKNREKLAVAGLDLVKQLNELNELFSNAEIGEASVDGDRAVVPVKLVTPTETKSGTVDLVRESGQWRLHYLRWGEEAPLWEGGEDPPGIHQRKREAQTEVRTLLKEIADKQRERLLRNDRPAKTFKELGLLPQPGNRYTYFLANSGPALPREPIHERRVPGRARVPRHRVQPVVRAFARGQRVHRALLPDAEGAAALVAPLQERGGTPAGASRVGGEVQPLLAHRETRFPLA